MTVTTTELRDPAQTAGPQLCDAIVDFFGTFIPCPVAAAGPYRRMCVHEHLRDGWLCQPHADRAAYGFCLPCPAARRTSALSGWPRYRPGR